MKPLEVLAVPDAGEGEAPHRGEDDVVRVMTLRVGRKKVTIYGSTTMREFWNIMRVRARGLPWLRAFRRWGCANLVDVSLWR